VGGDQLHRATNGSQAAKGPRWPPQRSGASPGRQAAAPPPDGLDSAAAAIGQCAGLRWGGALLMVTKIKRTIRGLDAVQAVYALIIALGFRQAFLAGYALVIKKAGYGSIPVVAPLVFLNLFVLGVRFFWLPRNLRTTLVTHGQIHAQQRAKAGKPEASDPAEDWAPPLANAVVAFSLVAIFLQAALFFAMCSEFEFLIFNAGARTGFQTSVFETYVLMHVLLLLVNAAWIACLTRVETGLGATVKHAGVVWYRNNLAFSVLALGPLVLFDPRPSAVERWLEGFDGLSQALFTLLPTSPPNTSLPASTPGGQGGGRTTETLASDGGSAPNPSAANGHGH
jgi:hypothetical protein